MNGERRARNAGSWSRASCLSPAVRQRACNVRRYGAHIHHHPTRETSLDRYIRRQASQDTRRRVARVFVASADPPERVAGYYTLSAASFEKDDLPAEFTRRLPHYPVPAAVIGRLAVDLRSQGNGLGEVLLLDAIHRVVRAGDTIGVYAIVVDTLHERASAFHERYGFAPFPSQPLRLYLPLRTFEQLGL